METKQQEELKLVIPMLERMCSLVCVNFGFVVTLYIIRVKKYQTLDNELDIHVAIY